jgi:dihydroflavonol-4-reductase
MDLVTGGCGFIGRHLVRELRLRGRRVRILDLRAWNGPLEGIDMMVGSITDAELVRKASEGCERIFHLAANPNLWAADPDDFDRVNHQGTRNLLAAAIDTRPSQFVYTSTESILKSRRAPANGALSWIDESVRLTLDDMPGPYCRSKFLAEEAAREAAGKGLPVVIVNPTMPLGPGDELLTPPSKMILGFLNGTTPAYLNCEFNIVDARDAAFGHILAAERGRVGERYLLGGTNLRLGELLRKLSELTGLPMPKRKVPYSLAIFAAHINEALANLTGIPPVAPVTGVRLARSSLAFNCQKAISELGWKARPLSDTLKDAIDWLNAQAMLTRPIAAAPR